MSVNHNDAEYNLAMQPAPRDTRTRDQRLWDDHKEAANQLLRKLALMTSRPWLGEAMDPYGFHHNAGTEPPRAPNYIEHVRDIVRDLDRELYQLSIMGGRPGDPVERIKAPAMVTTRPVGVEDRVIPLVGKIGGEAA